MLTDVVRKYTQENYNCSESLLRAMNEYYQLGLEENALKVASGFGGGLYSQDICGCLTGAVMGLSVMKVDDKSNTTPEFKDEIHKFYAAFKEKYQSVNCGELKQTQRHPVLGCTQFMIDVGDFVEEYIKTQTFEQ